MRNLLLFVSAIMMSVSVAWAEEFKPVLHFSSLNEKTATLVVSPEESYEIDLEASEIKAESTGGFFPTIVYKGGSFLSNMFNNEVERGKMFTAFDNGILPLPDSKVVPGLKRFFYVGTYDSSHQSHLITITFGLQRIESSNKWKLSLEDQGAGDMSRTGVKISQLARIAIESDKSFEVTGIIDAEEGEVIAIRLRDKRRNGISVVESVLLPESMKFDDPGQHYELVTDESITRLFVNQIETGETLVRMTFGESATAQQPKYQKKHYEKPFSWMTGQRSIQTTIDGRLDAVSGAMYGYFSGALSAIIRDKLDSSEKNFLTITVPDQLIGHHPGFSSEIIAEFLKADPNTEKYYISMNDSYLEDRYTIDEGEIRTLNRKLISIGGQIRRSGSERVSIILDLSKTRWISEANIKAVQANLLGILQGQSFYREGHVANILFLVNGRNVSDGAFRGALPLTGAASYFGNPMALSLETLLDQQAFDATLFRVLQKGEFNVPEKFVREVLEQLNISFRKNLSQFNPYRSLDAMAFYFREALMRFPEELMGNATEFSNLVLRLSGNVLANGFSNELVKKAGMVWAKLSNESSDVLPSGGLWGWDMLLRISEKDLVSWYQSGYKRKNFHSTVLMGDTGVGKSLYANRLAELLGAEIRTVNFSDNANGKNIYEVIRQAVNDLRASQKEARILFLDEVNVEPGMILALMNYFGDNDRSRELSFEGLQVIIALNNTRNTETYKQLISNSSPTRPDYIKLTMDLLTETLAGIIPKGREGTSDAAKFAQQVEAFTGRHDRVFFVPTVNDAEIKNLVRSEFRKFKEKYNSVKTKILVSAESFNVLFEYVKQYRYMNYRRIQAIVNGVLDGLVGEIQKNSDRKSVLRFTARNDNGITNFVLKRDGANASRPAEEARGLYEKVRAEVLGALENTIKEIKAMPESDDPRVNEMVKANLTHFERIAKGFKAVGDQALFAVREDGSAEVLRPVGEFCFPSCLSTEEERRMNSVMEAPLQNLFNYWRTSGVDAVSVSQPDTQTEVSAGSLSTLQLLHELSVIDAPESAMNRFFDWIRNVVSFDTRKAKQNRAHAANKAKLEFFEQSWSKWRELQEQFTSTATAEREQKQKLFAYLTARLASAALVVAKNPTIDLEDLSNFLQKIYTGTDALTLQSEIESVKKDIEGKASKDAVAAAQSVAKPTIQEHSIAAGYLIDGIIRRIVEVDYNNRLAEMKIPNGSVIAPNTAPIDFSQLSSAQCATIFGRAAATAQQVRDILGKKKE